jgi:hypothetical protein
VSTKICRPSEAWCGSERQQVGNGANKGLLSGASAVLPFLADNARTWQGTSGGEISPAARQEFLQLVTGFPG